MKPFLRTLTAAALAMLALPGCFDFDFGGGTKGDFRNVEFSYADGGFDCLFGCGIGTLLMLGTSQTIRIDPVPPRDHLPAFKAVSSDPTVLAVQSSASLEPDADAILVTGLRAGDAKIVLVTGDGVILDTATLRVEPAAAVQVNADISSAQNGSSTLDLLDVIALELDVGDDAVLTANVVDAQGSILAAWGEVTFSVDDPGVAQISPFFSPSLNAKAKGTTVLRVQVGDVTRAIPVLVK